MKTLHLTVTKEWFDKINSWEKKEDFREKKPYWFRRLVDFTITDLWTISFNKFDQVIIKNWYWDKVPTLVAKCTWIRITWEDEVTDLWTWAYFAIWIGEITDKFNINK